MYDTRTILSWRYNISIIVHQLCSSSVIFVSDADNSLPLTPDKNWLNMSKIEYDKLEWTKAVPAPSTGDKKTGSAARFDFQVLMALPVRSL